MNALPAAGDNPIPTRRHDIDALRVLAFGLLILYHCGMFYVADWGWHVKSQYQSEGLQRVMLLVNQWRMPLLFLISGMAVHFLLDKVSPGRFAWLRTKRLLLPLIFGMLVIVAPQAYFQGMSNGAFDYSYVEFYSRYITLQPWPEGAFDGWDFGWTWNHLWYLPYVLAYSLVLAGLTPLLRMRWGQLLMATFRRAGKSAVFLLPASLLYGIAVWLRRDHPQTHNFHQDGYLHAQYFTVFMLGYVLSNSDALWAKLKAMRWVMLALALLGYVTILLVRERLPDELSDGQYMAVYALLAANTWAWLCAVMGWGHTLLNRPFRWLPYATEAVYPWYILHQTLTVSAGYFLARWPGLHGEWGPVLEPVLLMGFTVGGCLLIHEWVIRRTVWLRPLFGLKARAGYWLGPGQ